MANRDLFCSCGEAVALVNALERRRLARTDRFGGELTQRQVKYLEFCGVLDVPRVQARVPVRVYGPVEIALLRTWVHLIYEGATGLTAQAALVYLRDELRRELAKPRSDRALVIRGQRGHVVPLVEVEQHAAAIVVPLEAVMRGTREAMAARRAAEPQLWTGCGYHESSTVATMVRIDG